MPHVSAGQSQTYQNQVIYEPLHNDGTVTIINCTLHDVTGTGTLICKGNNTLSGNVTQGSVVVGWSVSRLNLF